MVLLKRISSHLELVRVHLRLLSQPQEQAFLVPGSKRLEYMYSPFPQHDHNQLAHSMLDGLSSQNSNSVGLLDDVEAHARNVAVANGALVVLCG